MSEWGAIVNEREKEVRDMNNEQPAKTWPEHSCYEWNRQHYHMTPEYTSSECGTCGHITGFKWRSPWRRIVSLFTSNPISFMNEKKAPAPTPAPSTKAWQDEALQSRINRALDDAQEPAEPVVPEREPQVGDEVWVRGKLIRFDKHGHAIVQFESGGDFLPYGDDATVPIKALAAAPRAAGGQREMLEGIRNSMQALVAWTEGPNSTTGAVSPSVVRNWILRIDAALAAAEPQVEGGGK